MDELIFTLFSKKEPHVDDVMAVLKGCVAADGSAYCNVDEMQNDAVNGKFVGFDTQTAFRVQFHMSRHKKDNSGSPMFIFDLFTSNFNGRKPNTLECHLALSSDLSEITHVQWFTPVATRADYNERTLRAEGTIGAI